MLFVCQGLGDGVGHVELLLPRLIFRKTLSNDAVGAEDGSDGHKRTFRSSEWVSFSLSQGRQSPLEFIPIYNRRVLRAEALQEFYQDGVWQRKASSDPVRASSVPVPYKLELTAEKSRPHCRAAGFAFVALSASPKGHHMAGSRGKLVGIDLGTTFSAIATLDEHGQPITLPNRDGEMLTPSAVLLRDANAVVGQAALDVPL